MGTGKELRFYVCPKSSNVQQIIISLPVGGIWHEDVFSNKAPECKVAEDSCSRVAEGTDNHCVESKAETNVEALKMMKNNYDEGLAGSALCLGN